MDKNFTHINDDLLVKYLLGEADMDESGQVENWVKSHPNNQKQLADFKTILAKSQLEIDQEIDEHNALDRLNNRLQSETKVKQLGYRPILRWVAVVAVFFGVSWFFYSNLVANKINVDTNENTLTQVLPDGSTSILNKQSSLSFVGGFFNTTRKVKLTGEAFFKVKSNKSKPFIIDVHGIQVTVVGTEFNIKSDGNETIVVVESGIVKVNNQQGSIQLTAGEKVTVKHNQLRLIKEESKGKLYNYYYTNELVCDRTPLYELVLVLNEKFKANIIIANPAIKSLPISTTFKDESLKEILDIVGETLKIKVEYDHEIIKLK